MSVLGVLGPLDGKWFKKNKVAGCPYQHIPSDHFPLVVELELLNRKSANDKEKGGNHSESTGDKAGANSQSSNGHLRR